jgi:hypothetical protein
MLVMVRQCPSRFDAIICVGFCFHSQPRQRSRDLSTQLSGLRKIRSCFINRALRRTQPFLPLNIHWPARRQPILYQQRIENEGSLKDLYLSDEPCHLGNHNAPAMVGAQIGCTSKIPG